ncbi:hypothetical protein J2S74_001310 [Evansella vedderi]|uniref:Uncharacterized protein n=1 Tax=Evansella vedderi TaxID=38282 RepID=A0ABT9ZRS9_9BACI|nr:hypothetical protein [Evansella vedderi]MDQ0253937.1 hypothetical protein [Evansella vedderi]
MKENKLNQFPGQQKGSIQILIKRSEKPESVQLRLDLNFEDDTSSSIKIGK